MLFQLHDDKDNPGEDRTPPFSVQAVPACVRNMQYNVRGKVLDRAYEIEKSMKDFKFDQLLRLHIGNPHAVGSPALTYIREVVSLITCPKLMDPRVEQALLQVYHSDSLHRARAYRRAMGDPGAYTHSQGARCLREEISGFFERRDGIPADPDTLFLTNGASDAICTVLSCLVGGPDDAILLPLPQYPLYSATMTRLNGHTEYYQLDEDSGWRCTVASIDAAYQKATKVHGKNVKAIVVIAPGNPAPAVLSEQDVLDVLTYAHRHNLAVIADEVYQENVYGNGNPFVPFRRVLLEHSGALSSEPSGALKTQLVSLHSSSKGFYGECGFRGGLMQLENFDKDALSLIYKVRSVELCSNTIGQICMALVACPPKPGTPSFNQYLEERKDALKALAYKAQLMTTFFNSLSGVSCQPINGALYAFPRLSLPPKFVKEAEELGRPPDLHYCLLLLNATGIVTSPGNAFGPSTPAAQVLTNECMAPSAIKRDITPASVSPDPVSAPVNLPLPPMLRTAEMRSIPAAASKNSRLLISGETDSKLSHEEIARLPIKAAGEVPREYYHMRITILPTIPELSKALDSYRYFHEQLMVEYSSLPDVTA